MSLSRSVIVGTVILVVTFVAHAEETTQKVVPSSAQPVNKSTEAQIFEKILAQYNNLTYDQLKAELKPRQYLDKLSFDPATVKYFDRAASGLKLNDQERAIFKRNGFVSVDHDQRYSFASAYYAIYTRDLPVLITTDSILHAMHRSYDQILLELEMTFFSYTIEEVLTACHEELSRLAEQNRNPVLVDHYRDVDLYLTVARNLLAGAGADVSAPPDPSGEQEMDEWKGYLLVTSKMEQDAKVLEILSPVRSLTLQTPGLPLTTIYGGERSIDYSQFRPRGHYTKATILKRYFRTMMWIGRADCGWNINSDRELGNAVLLVELLTKTNSIKRIQTLDDLITFMVGRSDNLRIFDLLRIMQDHQLTTLGDITNVATRELLKKAIASGAYGQQRIRSQVMKSFPDVPEKVAPPQIFQLFGQRLVIDSFLLSQVVFDSIVYQGKKVQRFMPTGLDVMAALGNTETIPLLAAELTQYPYSANLKAGQVFVGLYDPDFWRENLYNIWLDALRILDDDMTQQKHFPQIMRTQTWQMKQLQTQLASWAELRHDTILYAKQSYTAFAVCEYPTGYVEPYPHLYAKVKDFAKETVRLLEKIDFSSPNAQKYGELGLMKMRQLAFLNTMTGHLGQLEKLAQKELMAQPFTSEEQLFLKKTIDARGGGSGGPNYDGWYCDLFYGGEYAAMKWDPTIADVHTDPNSGQVLEVGVGDANFLVAAIDNEEDHLVYVGPMFSYYEFTQPASKRLTDEEWQNKISNNMLPPRPTWTSSFQGPRQKREAGR